MSSISLEHKVAGAAEGGSEIVSSASKPKEKRLIKAVTNIMILERFWLIRTGFFFERNYTITVGEMVQWYS